MLRCWNAPLAAITQPFSSLVKVLAPTPVNVRLFLNANVPMLCPLPVAFAYCVFVNVLAVSGVAIQHIALTARGKVAKQAAARNIKTAQAIITVRFQPFFND